MSKKTDFVKECDFLTKNLSTNIVSNPNIGLGKIDNGPYLPIQSGEYKINVIETKDFNSFKIIGHY